MGFSENPAFSDPVARRYRLVQSIGRGGMAMVYEVQDLGTGQRLALKRMLNLPDEDKQRRSLELFEREYHALAELAHPRVVAVHDYGIDAGTPYYTMELLDGGDLQQVAPIDWRRTCALGRDLGSALSLLHSRGFVHRDLTPRNVRCTGDGLAKLIDFGALAAMGVTKHLVGTAAFCAPEVVNMQEVDGRADLYSLGATLYYTLAGRRAYPAADFRQLRELWRKRPRRVSEVALDIPAALDELVMAMLELDPALRPASAAEVMDRLSAIAGLPMDEQLLVSKAYLSTPRLVGREEDIARVRRRMARARRGRGGAVMLEGAPGAGRSRLLDACALMARLGGAVVLRADASDAHAGDYGVLRALAEQLVEAAPEAAAEAAKPRLALLGQVVPRLLPGQAAPAPEAGPDPASLRPRLQAALREWLLAVASDRLLVLAVDDVHCADEPSAAFLALLAHEIGKSRVLIATSAASDAAGAGSPALKLLADAGTRLRLEHLTPANVAELLGSVFGTELNLQLLAVRLYAISDGNPRDVMRLAQHLVDKQIVRYQAGAWSLRGDIDASDLPSSMSQALADRVAALSADARELACAIALAKGERFDLDDCRELLPEKPARVRTALGELLTAQVLRQEGERYALAQQGWLPVLRGLIAGDAARRMHLRLAAAFERRGRDGFRLAQHLLQAGEDARGLDLLVAEAKASQAETDRNPDAFYRLVRSLPEDWFATFAHGIALCRKLERPRRESMALQSRLAGLISNGNLADGGHMLVLIDQLYRDAGLDLYAALEATSDPGERLKQTFTRAQQRYAETSEHERGLDPVSAIRELAQSVLSATGVVASGHDYALWSRLPSVKAYEPLSPALCVVELLRVGLGARISARGETAREIYNALLARTAQPDRAGLEASHHRYTTFAVMLALGTLDASMGLSAALQWAERIENDPMHAVNALLLRMVYHLWQGNAQEAERCKRRVELLRVENAPRQWFEGAHLFAEVTAHAAAGDLMRVKHAMDEIEPIARVRDGWKPIHLYATGEYQRLRGDHASALGAIEQGLSLTLPGRNQIWADLAGAHVRALYEAGRHAEAVSHGERHLAAAEAAGLGHVRNYIRMPLALAQAQLGQHEAAAHNAEACVDEFEQWGSTGLNLGIAYETRARVAGLAHDQATFELAAERCAAQYKAGENPALSARYAKLIEDARQAELGVSADLAEAAEFTAHTLGLSVSHVTSVMESCTGPRERAHCALDLLARHSGGSGGWLYGGEDGAPAVLANFGQSSLPASIDKLARDFLRTQLELGDATQHGTDAQTTPESTAEWFGERGESYRPILLAHPTDDGLAVLALAILVVEPGSPFVYPGEVAAEVSRLVHEAGDTSSLFALVG